MERAIAWNETEIAAEKAEKIVARVPLPSTTGLPIVLLLYSCSGSNATTEIGELGQWKNVGVLFIRIENGKVVELDTLFDVLGHLKQLGATISPQAQAGN